MPVLRWLTVIVCLLVPSLSSAERLPRLQLTGEALEREIILPVNRILPGSDSLVVGLRTLRPATDYEIQGQRVVWLAWSPAPGDTIRIWYTPLPVWLEEALGPGLPTTGFAERSPPGSGQVRGPVASSVVGDEISIGGTKTFRVISRSEGGSEFGQSLDLSLVGRLGDSVEVVGTISDRGTDIAYGPANSRISEVDRLNLSLTSPSVSGAIGDITIADIGAPSRQRELFGASAAVTFPVWRVRGAVARPKGRFATARFDGLDGFQGPYDISSASGFTPIVPGSDAVWVDGVRLERGSNLDYTIDYATGQIIFSVRQPIDSRSRIEIDYEPLRTAYEQELLLGESAVFTRDSALSFSVGLITERDDVNQSLIGELTESDRDLLAAAGDSTPTRSGVSIDSLGSYRIDSTFLPDTVVQFVGVGNGDLRVRFTRVGSGGDYRFLGQGIYEFVGFGGGDYLPIVEVAAPVGLNELESRLTYRSPTLGVVEASLSSTSFDRNRLSDLDDDDNSGVLARIRWTRANDDTNPLFGTIDWQTQDANYRARMRLQDPDATRRYLLPLGAVSSDEQRVDGRIGVALRNLTIAVQGGRRNVPGQFTADRFGADATIRPTANWSFEVSGIRTESSLQDEGNGESTELQASLRRELGRGWYSVIRGRYDTREANYAAVDSARRYTEARFEIGSSFARLAIEDYREDTVVSSGTWLRSRERQRIIGTISRTFGYLATNAAITYQRAEFDFGRELGLLAQTTARYFDPRRRLSVAVGYTVSEERRNARGVTFLEVPVGEGSFREEDGEFIPDPNGNFIRVEELLSDAAAVQRGEKTVTVDYDLGPVVIRASSRIDEELLSDGDRSLLWALPFYNDPNLDYLVFLRQTDVRADLGPRRGFYAATIAFTEERESRRIAELDRRRTNDLVALTLRQALGPLLVAVTGERFQARRDSYFSGAGDIDGYASRLQVTRSAQRLELTGRVGWRRSDDRSGATARRLFLTLAVRQSIARQSDVRVQIEGYRQVLRSSSVGSPSVFLLTGDRPGERGIVWSTTGSVRLRQSLRIDLSVNGRHADDRSGRVTARAEVIARL